MRRLTTFATLWAVFCTASMLLVQQPGYAEGLPYYALLVARISSAFALGAVGGEWARKK